MGLSERFSTFVHNDRFSPGINFKGWIFRYGDKRKWQAQGLKVLHHYFIDKHYREGIVKKANPSDQYKIMELMSRFSNPNIDEVRDGFYENTVMMVGDLYGDILIDHVMCSDKDRRREFIDGRLLLTIDNRSKVMGLDKLFQKVRNGGLTLKGRMVDYLAYILFKDLGINDREIVNRSNGHIPEPIIDKIITLLQEREEQDRRVNGRSKIM
jgi:hypothetical protein